MKKILSYLQYKEILFPFIGFIGSLVLSYCAKRFMTGPLGNGLCIFGVLTAITCTDIMGRFISMLRQQEYDEKEAAKKRR